jgi:enterochelin esterase-like enzyme
MSIIRKGTRSFLFLFCWLVACTPVKYPPLATPSNTVITPSVSPLKSPASVVCTQSHGHFELQEIQTALLTHPLYFRVYLPACYGDDKARRYPVLYLLHGQGFNDDQWDRLRADEVMDELIAAGEIPPFILVLPRESNYMINQWQSKYGRALAEELVPWVDAHYQACTDRACRAIGGISRGAGWAMRIGLMNWQLFSAIGAHSFAPFRGDFNAFPLWVKAIPQEKLPRIWIDVGDRDFIASAAQTWKNRLDDYQVPHEWHVFPGSHTEKYWAANVSTYIRWYSAGWKNLS